MKNKGVLIALTVIIAVFLSCVVTPIGIVAFMYTKTANSVSDANAPLPASVWREQIISGSGIDRIVVITVSGVIGAEGSDSILSNDPPGHSQILSQIRQAATDPLVKAVVLRVDSPGGGVVASNEIYTELLKIRDKGKPLIVSMGSLAASGGYYISTPADRIYANAATITGSLGVIISSLNYTEAFEKIGFEQVVYKSGTFKDILSPARKATAAEDKILQTFIDTAYQTFVDVIADGRGMERDTVLEIADGRIYSGQQALELHLVDELGGIDDAIDGAKELAALDTALVVRYKYKSSNSLEDLLFKAAEQSMQPADPFAIHELMKQQTPKVEYRLVP